MFAENLDNSKKLKEYGIDGTKTLFLRYQALPEKARPLSPPTAAGFDYKSVPVKETFMVCLQSYACATDVACAQLPLMYTSHPETPREDLSARSRASDSKCACCAAVRWACVEIAYVFVAPFTQIRTRLGTQACIAVAGSHFEPWRRRRQRFGQRQ